MIVALKWITSHVVSWYARRSETARLYFDDMQSEAWMGVIYAVRKFDQSRVIKENHNKGNGHYLKSALFKFVTRSTFQRVNWYFRSKVKRRGITKVGRVEGGQKIDFTLLPRVDFYMGAKGLNERVLDIEEKPVEEGFGDPEIDYLSAIKRVINQIPQQNIRSATMAYLINGETLREIAERLKVKKLRGSILYRVNAGKKYLQECLETTKYDPRPK